MFRSLFLLSDTEMGQVLAVNAVYIYEFPQFLNNHMMPNTPPPSLLHCPKRREEMVVRVRSTLDRVGLILTYIKTTIFEKQTQSSITSRSVS